MTPERMDDESWRITKELLAGVGREIARGCDPSEEEPDEHRAVRLVEVECDRARASETALRADLAKAKERISELEASARYAVEALRPVALSGKVPQGGEQTGNSEHLLYAYRGLGGR